MIKAIAVDDEPIALEILGSHAENIDFIDLRDTFFSASKALAYIRQEKIQLVFLDIQMPDLSGIELAEMIGQESKVISTTAYAEHALEAFNLAATDYLLKPITFERFFQACNLARTRLATSPEISAPMENGLFFKDGYTWKRIDTTRILYAEASDNYVSLIQDQQKTTVRITLNDLLRRLPQGRSIRAHKSFIVAIAAVDKMERNFLTISGKTIPVSQSYRPALLKAFSKM